MGTTPENVTDEQIAMLRAEALEAGDLKMMQVCDSAVCLGNDRARAECARVIAEAEAQGDDDGSR
jgi:hypothetical protein